MVISTTSRSFFSSPRASTSISTSWTTMVNRWYICVVCTIVSICWSCLLNVVDAMCWWWIAMVGFRCMWLCILVTWISLSIFLNRWCEFFLQPTLPGDTSIHIIKGKRYGGKFALDVILSLILNVLLVGLIDSLSNFRGVLHSDSSSSPNDSLLCVCEKRNERIKPNLLSLSLDVWMGTWLLLWIGVVHSSSSSCSFTYRQWNDRGSIEWEEKVQRRRRASVFFQRENWVGSDEESKCSSMNNSYREGTAQQIERDLFFRCQWKNQQHAGNEILSLSPLASRLFSSHSHRKNIELELWCTSLR